MSEQTSELRTADENAPDWIDGLILETLKLRNEELQRRLNEAERRADLFKALAELNFDTIKEMARSMSEARKQRA